MSTNSATQFSVEDDESLSETPIPSQQKSTRGSPCSKSHCLVCNGPVTNNCVHNLTVDLEESNLHSRSNKPTAPTDHWITDLSDAFKDTILDHDIEEMKHLNIYYLKLINESSDLHQYNLTELKKLSATAIQIIAAYNQTTNPVTPPPPS